jgi:hypothetical protein
MKAQDRGEDKPEAGSSPRSAFVKSKEEAEKCCHNYH